MAAETIIDFLQEARQSLEEVAYAIREGKMSNTLQCDSSCVHLNLTTLEGLRFCVRLSLRGFEVHLFLSRSQLSAAIHTTSSQSIQYQYCKQSLLWVVSQATPFALRRVWLARLCCGLLVSCPDPTLSRGKGSGDH